MLLGGGRWGRVHASNLLRLLGSNDSILWVSRHTGAALTDFTASLAKPSSPTVSIVGSIEEALAFDPEVAIVATLPETHADIAGTCLRAGLDVFVEKPLAFTRSEAEELLSQATKHQRLLGVGMHLLSASYLRYFKSLVASRAVSAAEIWWHDPRFETRYGEVKESATSVPLAHDVYPHIWSVVTVLTGVAIVEPVSIRHSPSGIMSCVAAAGDIHVTVHLGRRHTARERRVRLTFADGGSAEIDFTREPGVILVDDIPMPPDPAWGVTPTPLLEEVTRFLALTKDRREAQHWAHAADRCLDSVSGAEKLLTLSNDVLMQEIAQHAAAPPEGRERLDLAWDVLVNRSSCASADRARMTQIGRDDLSRLFLDAITDPISQERDTTLAQQVARIGAIADRICTDHKI